MHNTPMLMKAGLLLAAVLVFMTTTSTAEDYRGVPIVNLSKNGLRVTSSMKPEEHTCDSGDYFEQDKLVADWSDMAKGDKNAVYEVAVRITITEGHSKPVFKANLKASETTTLKVDYDNIESDEGALIVDGAAFDLPPEWINLSFSVGEEDGSKKAYVEAPVVGCFMPEWMEDPGRFRRKRKM